MSCLIAAINKANRNGRENTINLEAGIYTLTTIDNGVEFSFDGANGLPLIVGRMTIRGQGSSLTTIERDINPVFASPRFCIFRIALTGALTLESLALRRGIATSHGGILFSEGNLTITETDVSEGLLEIGNPGGGGIRNVGTLTVRSSRIFRNSALEVRGGGILNEGMALIEDSFIFLNQAADPFLGAGGGIFNTSELILTRTNLVNNRGGFAGGVLANSGRANLNSVFIWLNGVSAGFPPTPRSVGGGIFNNSSMELNIISSTIAENAAEEEGGGILDFRGRVTVTNSTIVANHILEVVDAIRAGGIRNEDQLEIQNSILPLNSGPTDPDCSGLMLSLGGNIIGDTSGCLIVLRERDLTGDPGLGELVVESPAGRGYVPLLANSPAIDSANPVACPATDQLGLPRVGICDRGSVEFQDGRQMVNIDIRPRTDANRINPNSTKEINVAILSGNGFDASRIDPNTVRFGATGTEAAPVTVGRRDVDGDGDRDMVLRFQIPDTGIKCGDTFGVLTGRFLTGRRLSVQVRSKQYSAENRINLCVLHWLMLKGRVSCRPAPSKPRNENLRAGVVIRKTLVF